ncbi:B-cell receptor CD22-like [Engystomops pustulosus]|uniref:B-cell receptor CD22-like n=1 Tax=Engystomops pustulosus TaxID=76066 RepID=UPI003AFA43CB
MSGVIQMFPLIIFQGFYLGSVCQWWTFPSRITALLGSCVEIPCTYHGHKSGTVWYLYRYSDYLEILNTKDSSSVMEEYRDRTSLVPGDKSCTLRIDPVRWEDDGWYYPGITNNRRINAYSQEYKTIHLNVKDSLAEIYLEVLEVLKEGEATIIRSVVYHTCGTSPPDLQWNKPGRVIKKSVDLMYGLWREESALTYTPSYEDDGSLIQCTATHPNGQRTEGSGTLKITYIPKNVAITVIGKDEVMEGSDVTLQCNSVSRPDVSEYEWYKGETRLPDRGREMTVRSVTRDMELYSCAARNTVGKGESAPIHIPGCSNVLWCSTGRLGKSFAEDRSSHCLMALNPVSVMSSVDSPKQLEGLPAAYKDFADVFSEKQAEILPPHCPYDCSIDLLLAEKNVKTDALSRASDVVGEESAPRHIVPLEQLVVLAPVGLWQLPPDAPKNVTITVIGMDEFLEGSDVMLQCNSVSRPDVSEYEWYKGETRLPDRGREMTVRSVTRDMEPYSCAARNTVGRGESAPIQIPVIYAADGVNITVRNDHELVCDFGSSRPDVTHYTWRKDGSILHNETGKTLTIDNNGRYSCIAHNTAGDSSSQEIHIQRDSTDFPLILGAVAGVFFLLLCVLAMYLSSRKIWKSCFLASPKLTSPTPGILFSDTNGETLYEIIQTQPDSMEIMSSVNVKGNEVIYSNNEVLQTTNEVEYSVISHVPGDRTSSSRVIYVDNVLYAALR